MVKYMRSKRAFVGLFAFIVIVVIVIFIFFFSRNEKKDFQTSLKFLSLSSYKENIEVSLGSEIPHAKDYSSHFQDEITWIEDMQEKIKIPGTYLGFVLNNYQLHILSLTVKDEEAPMIQNVKDITITVGDKVDLEKQVIVIDNSNDEIKLVIKGEYSFDKEGVYSLMYEATDSSGNSSTKPFKLIVKKKAEPKQKPISSSTDEKSSKGYSIIYKNGAYYVKGILIANKTYALSSSYAPGGLTKETSVAFEQMKNDAAKEGINLKVISGYRSYSHQNSIYNNYVKRDGKKEADRYSARPGHSEHQTGLAFDVNSLEQSFGATKAGIWLSENCYKYGFVLRYPKGKENITGYMYEPWHFRYIGSEAKNLYNNGSWITLEEYLGIDSKYSS